MSQDTCQRCPETSQAWSQGTRTPKPLACKVAEWASLSVIGAWPAANSRVHHRQVALLLLHFAAAGSLSQRR